MEYIGSTWLFLVLYLKAQDRNKRNPKFFTSNGAIRAGVTRNKEPVTVEVVQGKHNAAIFNDNTQLTGQKSKERRNGKTQTMDKTHTRFESGRCKSVFLGK